MCFRGVVSRQSDLCASIRPVPEKKIARASQNPLRESHDGLNGLSQTPTHAPLAGQITS
jgi:hypothetical protein